MKTLAVTGNLGCGKSTVSRLLADRGADVTDADALVHELLAEGGAAVPAVLAAFPEAASRGGRAVDRTALAQVAFADAPRLHELEACLHPLVFAEVRQRLARAAARGVGLAVVEATLLFESVDRGTAPAGCLDDFDEILAVTCDPAVAMARAVARQAGAAEDAEAELRRRLAHQMPQDEKARRATIVVDNSGTLAETAARVAVVHSGLVGSGSVNHSKH